MYYQKVLHLFVLVVSLGTLTAANSVPPWESPCGKTTVQSALLDILGPVPKPTVSIKRMLHNVIIELKETDEKIATIQQYYIQHKLINATEAGVIQGEESNLHHIIGFPVYKPIRENETIEDVFFRDYETFSSVLVFLEQSSWDVIAMDGDSQALHQMLKSTISKILGILCKYSNAMENRIVTYVSRDIMLDDDRDVNIESRILRKRDFIIMKDTRVLLKKMIPDYALLKQNAP